MGIGTMMPFARGHSEKGTIDQEPWSFGPEVASQIFHKLWNLD
jgi:alpha-glucosidase